MSNETPENSAAAGTSAADSAPTAEIPRVPRPDKEPVAPAEGPRPTPSSNVGTIGDLVRPAEGDSAAARNGSPSPSATAAGRPHKPVVAENPGRKPETGSSSTRPITAGEYARTTNPSPSTTAVIPVVRGEDSAPRPSSAAAAAAASSGRQASLKLVRVDPWSVTKVTFALTVALMIVAVVAVTILWIVLSFAGVWDQINSSVTTVLSDDSSSFDITEYLGFGRIVGLTLVLSAINVVIVTAVATIGAYLYNLAAQLLGGVDVTLAEED